MGWSNAVSYTDKEKELLRRFSNCTLEHGNLKVAGDQKALSDFLRDNILDCKIPFYKVVGIYAQSGNVKDIKNIVSSLSGFDRSYIQLMESVSNIICADAADISALSLQMHFSIDCKCAMAAYASTVDEWITTTEGLFKPGEGVESKVDCLVLDKQITKISSNSCTLNLVLAKNNGIVDYSDIQNSLPHNYVPIRAIYNLGRYITVAEHKQGDGAIKLLYTDKINEKVLEQIIKDWAINSL